MTKLPTGSPRRNDVQAIAELTRRCSVAKSAMFETLARIESLYKPVLSYLAERLGGLERQNQTDD